MDIVLNIHDRYIFTPYIYPEQGWPEDDLLRQLISLTILVNINAVILYFFLASFSYFFLYDKQQMNHPLFLKVNENERK
jgi:lathosterol oxidase